MTATRADIIKDALRALRRLGAGREPDAEDEDIVGTKLDRIYARLRARGLTNDGSGVWALTAVPDEFAEELVILTAAANADTFHVPEERLVRLRLEEVEARNEITRLAGRDRQDTPAVAEQY